MAISWVLTGGDRKVTKYIGTLGGRFLSIPKHEVEFFLSLLGEVHRVWLELIRDANEHLSILVYHPPPQSDCGLWLISHFESSLRVM